MDTDQELVERARNGDRVALDALVKSCKDLVYHLALRMLADRADAEDAAQEILIRVVTGLATFRGDSSFKTWVYRVASNHLLTTRKRRAESMIDSLETMATVLDTHLATDPKPLDDQVLVAEAKLRCTAMMLLGLDRDHRLAFILGEILDLSSDEGAQVLGISSDAYRKRLSRARDRMASFTQRQCGLVDPSAACRCAKQASCAVKEGRLDPNELSWSHHPVRLRTRAAGPPFDTLEKLDRAVEVLRTHPDYAAPAALTEVLRQLVDEAAPAPIGRPD